MKVGDVMTRRVHSCSPSQSLADVVQTLWKQDVGALPVVNEQGQPLAMVTDRDAAVAACTQGRPLHEIAVHVAMSKALYTAHVSDSLSAAERMMRDQQVRRLPVVDESGRLAGILSAADVVRLRAGKDSPHGSDILQTLAGIGRPHGKPAIEPEPSSPPQTGTFAAAPAASPTPESTESAEKPAVESGKGRRRAKR